MAKKDLLNKMQSGLGSMLQPTTQEQEPTAEELQELAQKTAAAELAQPESNAGSNAGKTYKHTGNASTLGLRNGETRYTIILREDTLAKAREMAYLTRRTMRATIEDAVEKAIAEYEKEHGTIVPFKAEE